MDAFKEAGWFTPAWYIAAILIALAEAMLKSFPFVAVGLLVLGLTIDSPMFSSVWVQLGVVLLMIIAAKRFIKWVSNGLRFFL